MANCYICKKHVTTGLVVCQECARGQAGTRFAQMTSSPEVLAGWLDKIYNVRGNYSFCNEYCKSDCKDTENCQHELECVVAWLMESADGTGGWAGMSELKPCPFCGGTDFITAGGYADYCRWELRCQGCLNRFNGGYDGFKAEQEMIIAWNTRTDPEKDRLQQENRQLRYELEEARANIQAACQYGWSIADGSKKENEQLRALVRFAVEDMKYCNNCDACKFKDCQPSCKRGSFGCGLECECCQCLHESNFTWQHANKLKELGVEV